MGIIEEALSRLRTSGQPEVKKPRRAEGAARAVVSVQAESRTEERTSPSSSVERILPAASAGGPLVNVQSDALSRVGILTSAGEAGGFGEDFKGLKFTVLDNAFGKQRPASIAPLNLVMVTSTIEGEGKTFTSMNLAQSLATERDHGVILIDADPIKQTITRALGLTGGLGLMDLLLDDDLPVSSVISPTDVPGLRVIPSGHENAQAAELLSSRRMEALANLLAETFADDILLFDAPPLLMTHEARVMTKLAGQILLVVQAGRTRQDSLAEAVSMIAPSRVTGIVLNRSSDFDRLYRGGYYYGGYRAPDVREGG